MRWFHELPPVLYMVAAVVSWSTIPAIFKLANGSGSPFLFTSIWLAAEAFVLGAALAMSRHKLLLRPEVAGSVISMFGTRLMMGSFAGQMGFPLFALGLVLVDASIAAVLYETWPIFLMLFMSLLFRNEGRYRAIPNGAVIFSGLSLCGIALVVASQSATHNPLLRFGEGFSGTWTLAGAGLVMAASLLWAVHGACTIRMGATLAKRHAHLENSETGEIVFSMAVTGIVMTVASLALCAIGVMMSETISMRQVGFAMVAGGLIDSLGGAAFRMANLKTRNLGLNAVSYATPLVALAWLWALSLVSVPHPVYLIVGACGIVAANAMLNTIASRKNACLAFVAFMCAIGILVMREIYA